MNDQPQPGCVEFQKGRLLQYAYGELSAREMDVIRRHLETCPDCRAAAEAMARVRAAAAEAILRENPPAVLEVKLRAAARERRAGGLDLTSGIFGRLWQPRLLYAAAGVAALVAVTAVSWHFWSARRLSPAQVFDPGSVVALAEEVDGWKEPVLQDAEPDLTPIERLEQEMDEWTDQPPAKIEAWYKELNQSGLDDIEKGFRELDSGVKNL